WASQTIPPGRVPQLSDPRPGADLPGTLWQGRALHGLAAGHVHARPGDGPMAERVLAARTRAAGSGASARRRRPLGWPLHALALRRADLYRRCRLAGALPLLSGAARG